MTVWFATGNIHKKKELGAILLGAGLSDIEIKIPKEAGITFDPEETGSSFLENALLKAEVLYRLLKEKRPSLYAEGDPVIADDSGICVDALDGRPGIHSARYCGPGEIINGKKFTDEERNALLLSELGDNRCRGARFVCAMVLFYCPERFFIAQETMEGELSSGADASRGKGGFGYDPILYIPECGRTVAELSDSEKNLLSHRGKAGRAIAGLFPVRRL